MGKVLITPRSFLQSGEQAFRLLRDKGYEIVNNSCGKTLTEEQMVEACAEIEGLIVGVDPVNERVLRNATKLRAVSKYGSGLDNVDMKTAEELGIMVDRAAGTNSTSVAELAVGLLFSLSRSIPASAANTKNGGWDRKRGSELAGKIVGIIGMGNIGKEVARICFGLNMKIIACDPYLNPGDEAVARYSVALRDMEYIFRNADFVTLHLPLTEETRFLINKTTLSFMKPAAYLVNTSRGELIDENALYEALSGGVIAGAAEDVFSREPPDGHLLLNLDNFILTPHIGAYTVEANEKMAVKSTENLIRMLENKDVAAE